MQFNITVLENNNGINYMTECILEPTREYDVFVRVKFPFLFYEKCYELRFYISSRNFMEPQFEDIIKWITSDLRNVNGLYCKSVVPTSRLKLQCRNNKIEFKPNLIQSIIENDKIHCGEHFEEMVPILNQKINLISMNEIRHIFANFFGI